MATVTALQRGTPTFMPTTTQNTAPVHEFRCLYTRDVHKKSKKWHDGSLRFHTFNNRVMVYDDGKNFIGDLHYRQEDEFDEGVEIQLDRGVKVEVGERIGETQTDLAQVLNRRKPEDSTTTSPDLSTRTNVTQRLPPSLTSQQRPRSIAEVLGTSQTRTGRARLPIQSPFEQRQMTQQVQVLEPPNKRQRIAPGKENNVEIYPGLSEVRPVEHQDFGSAAPASTTAIEFTEIVDISSDEEAALSMTRRVKPPKPRKDKDASVNKPVGSEGAPSRLDGLQPPPLRDSKLQSVPTRNRADTLGAVSKPRKETRESKATAAAPHTTTSQTRLPNSGKTSLRFASQPQRQKLMYTALLPTSGCALTNKITISSTRSPDVEPSKTCERHPDVTLVSEERSHLHEAQLDETRLLSSSPEASQTPTTPEKAVSTPKPAAPSPMFISQEGTGFSPSPSEHCSQTDFAVPLMCQDFPSQLGLGRTLQAIPGNGKVDHQILREKEDIQLLMQSPLTQASEPALQTVQEVVLPAARLMPPPPVTSLYEKQDDTASTLQQRSFRRVRSANDATVDERDGVVLDEPIAAALLSYQKRTTGDIAQCTRKKNTVKLRRTASDTAAMETDSCREPLNILLPDNVEETGPWTTMEAYMLFDWWPPDRAKPDFGEVEKPGVVDIPRVTERPGFTSARDVLRDDINAL